MVADNVSRRGSTQLLKVFEPMLRFSARLERGTVDLTRPRTEIGRLETQINASMDALDATTLVSAVGELLHTFTPDGVAAAVTDLPPRPMRRQCKTLNDYLDIVDRDAPFTLGIVYAGSKLFGLDFTAKSLEAIGKLRDAARGSGETRLEALRIAAGFILESLYKELIVVLYEIECVRRSQPIAAGLGFGNLVENVAHSTCALLPGFVDRHAARIRNAGYHDRWQERALGSNLIDLHETEPSLRAMTPPQIYQRLCSRYRDVQDLTHCIMWRATASLLSLCGQPPLTRVLTAMFAGTPHDPVLTEQLWQVLGNVVGNASARLMAVNWTPRRHTSLIPKAS
jgi:hypothetical protein